MLLSLRKNKLHFNILNIYYVYIMSFIIFYYIYYSLYLILYPSYNHHDPADAHAKNLDPPKAKINKLKFFSVSTHHGFSSFLLATTL